MPAIENIALNRTNPWWIVALAIFATLAMPSTNARAAGDAYFLVARPNLVDPLFEQSVILMLPPPAVPLIAGVIINKPTSVPVKRVFPRAVDLKEPTDSAFFGGPVEPESALLVRRTNNPLKDEMRVVGDLYLSVDPQVIAQVLKNPDQDKQDLDQFMHSLSSARLHPLVRQRSRRDRQSVYIFASGDEEKSTRMLIATFERDEATVIQVKVDINELLKWIDSPMEASSFFGKRGDDY